MELLVKKRDFLNGRFLSRNTGDFVLQPTGFLATVSRQFLGELGVVFPKDVGDDVGSLYCDPLGSAAPTPPKIEANQANGFAGELFTTERTDGGKTSGCLCDYVVGAIAAQNMT